MPARPTRRSRDSSASTIDAGATFYAPSAVSMATSPSLSLEADLVSLSTTGRGWELSLDRSASDTLRIRLAGTWRLQDRLPPPDAVDVALADTLGLRQVVLDARDV